MTVCESEVNLALTGLRLRKYYYIVKDVISYSGQSAVYDCLVPFDDRSMETGLDMLQLLLDHITVLRT